MIAAVAGVFALRVALRGNAAFSSATPRRIHGKRSIHGESRLDGPQRSQDACSPKPAASSSAKRYRVDKDSVAERGFRADDGETWGAGGQSPLLCFDGSFGSGHGIVFAGSGGFKTTSVTVPTALKWGGSLVALDPSNEVAPMVVEHRRNAGRDVFILDPRDPSTGFNVLDWIGRFGGTKEEDVVAVANWVVTDTGRQASIRDDFFRASALQLITALIADVCLSGHTERENQHLRQMRTNLAEPEPKLRQRLQAIYDNSESDFVKENVAPFIAMTPETFSGVYANAVKETHWLSYPNYAALVSGSSFATDDLADGDIDVFVNVDLKTLETHPGLARTIIGALLNAIYNRNGEVKGRTLFLLDEVARLGYPTHPRNRARRRPQIWCRAPAVVPVDRADARNLWRARRHQQMVRVRLLGIVRGDQRSRHRRLHLPALRQHHSRGRPAQPVVADVWIVTDPIQTPHGAAADPARRKCCGCAATNRSSLPLGNAPLRCGRAIWFRRADMKTIVAGENHKLSRQAEDAELIECSAIR